MGWLVPGGAGARVSEITRGSPAAMRIGAWPDCPGGIGDHEQLRLASQEVPRPLAREGDAGPGSVEMAVALDMDRDGGGGDGGIAGGPDAPGARREGLLTEALGVLLAALGVRGIAVGIKVLEDLSEPRPCRAPCRR